MSTLTTHVELEVEVEFTSTKGIKGTRDRYGVPEEPDDDDEVEITAVNVMTQKPGLKPVAVDIWDLLTKGQHDAIEQQVWEHIAKEEP